MSELSSKQCIPCQGGVPALKGAPLRELHQKLGTEWEIHEEHHLSRTFSFSDFAGGLAFVNRVGEMAEQQNHHPDIYLAWGKVRVDVWTHKVDGLTESDFVFAARTQELFG